MRICSKLCKCYPNVSLLKTLATISVLCIVFAFFASLQRDHQQPVQARLLDVRSVAEDAEPNDTVDVYRVVQEATDCFDRPLSWQVLQKGDFWVFYNFVPSDAEFRCYETVTYTTQGDYTFLDNVVVLVKRWQGPISVAIYAPGDDFGHSLDSIAYLRNCETPLVRQYVTFHLFFESQHFPKMSSDTLLKDSYVDTYNCSRDPPYKNKDANDLYKTLKNLTYPINVARNVAREAAQTHFVFPSDIELYPVPNFIPRFLRMVAEKAQLFLNPSPKVFVLPIFEILAKETVPETKTELIRMINSSKAFFFHAKLCQRCHRIPDQKEWLRLPEDDRLEVSSVAKRQKKFSRWEAFYVGTNRDPFFDERLTWEGQSNKMTQAYIMCLLDYDYMVLDDAFLVHKPGLKRQKFQMVKRGRLVAKTNKLIATKIKPELDLIYGKRTECHI